MAVEAPEIEQVLEAVHAAQVANDPDCLVKQIEDDHRQQLLSDHYSLKSLDDHCIKFDTKPVSDNDDPLMLEFDCDFESGNIGTAERIGVKGNDYMVSIRGDTMSPRHSVWYYFRIRNGKKGYKITIHVNNYSKGSALYKDGFTPVIRSKTKPIWTRMPSKNVTYFRCIQHNRNCFTFSFIFDNNNDEYFFAYSYPYTYSYLQKFLTQIESLNLPYVTRQVLCRSIQQRRVDCLKIHEDLMHKFISEHTTPDTELSETALPEKKKHNLVSELQSDLESNDYHDKVHATNQIHDQNQNEIDIDNKIHLLNSPTGKKQDVIVFSARCHPGETPSSFVCHGLIEFLISTHPTAKYLRQNCTIFVIPMLNPDGVYIGNYRSTSLGFDLNRQWQNPNWKQHPSISSVKYLLRQVDVSDKLNLKYYCDLHAHTNATDGFMYCNPQLQDINIENSDSEEISEKTETNENENNENIQTSRAIKTKYFEKKEDRNDYTSIFPRLLDVHCDEFAFSKTKFCSNPKKAGSARRAMEAVLSYQPICYTFEVSFWKSKHASNPNPSTYTPETYRNLGRCMISAMADIFRVPQLMRHKLKSYNLKSHKHMKGDMRCKARKALNFAMLEKTTARSSKNPNENISETQRNKKIPDKMPNSKIEQVGDI